MQNLDIEIPLLLKTSTQAEAIGYNDKIPRLRRLQTDSRKVEAGDWFICLRGENFDAHEFVPQVFKKNPAGIIFRRDFPFAQEIKENLYGVAVNNTHNFLGHLANHWRRQVNPFVTAITGSNGKTSAKEILFALLSAWQKKMAPDFSPLTVQRTQGNLNNQFGLPITLLSLHAQTKFLVAEMGTNHAGEISPLSHWAMPNAGALVSISESHIGNFKNLDEIGQEKSSLIDGFADDGFLFVPKNLNCLPQVQAYCQKKSCPLFFADTEILKLKSMQKNGAHFTYKQNELFFPFAGRHQFDNLQLMFSLFQKIVQQKESSSAQEEIFLSALQALRDLPPIDGRLHSIDCGALTLWDDAYNANLASFKAAIDFLKTDNQNELRAAVGNMAELGAFAVDSHIALGKLFAQAGFSRIAFFSAHKELQEAFAQGYAENPHRKILRFFLPSQDERIKAAQFLREKINSPTDILVKGSHSTDMKFILPLLQAKN